ncbi:hypothetical protein HaLaN_02790 [Haematococcus lacustris]|uniref:Uncharacterized protein n=1 Tax=Haematococcus lacustris TaxID=44745 RepID=A0A699YD08_HAELA|nr:hypothetical protein HaLaN_02790 [Haematococcus lacustris]
MHAAAGADSEYYGGGDGAGHRLDASSLRDVGRGRPASDSQHHSQAGGWTGIAMQHQRCSALGRASGAH